MEADDPSPQPSPRRGEGAVGGVRSMNLMRRFRPFGWGWVVLHAVVIAGTFLAGYFTRFGAR